MEGLIFIDRFLIAWRSAATSLKTLEILLLPREITFFMRKMFPLNFFKAFNFFFQIFTEKVKVNKTAFFPCIFQVFSQTLRTLSSVQGPSSSAIPLWSYCQRGCHWMEHVAAIREEEDQWRSLASFPSLLWKLLRKYSCTLKKLWLCLANIQDSLRWEIF